MKKTLSVTLGGRAYTIEEDAYAALDAYVNKIRAQFKGDPNVDELVSDMEAGMADVFEKQRGKQKDTVLTLADVEAMMSVMGAPEEIAEEEPVAPGGTAKDAPREEHATGATGPKRLYRNTDDVVIAGVCSGLAAYFGVDPVIVRIGFILLVFVNGLGILAYIILWAAMPKAETSAQKLEMRGKPVNLEEIGALAKEKAEMMRDEGKAAVERLREHPEHSTAHKILQIPVRVVEGVFNAIKAVVRVIVPTIAVIAGIVLCIVSAALSVALAVSIGMMVFGLQSPYIHTALPLDALTQNPIYFVALGSVFLVALIPLLFLMKLAASLLTRRNRFQGTAVAIGAAVWVIAVGVTAGTATHLVPFVHEQLDEYDATHSVSRELTIEEAVHTLRVTGNTDVQVTRGDVPSATFRGWGEDVEQITVSVKEGELHIDQPESKRLFLCLFCQRLRPHGVLTLPELTHVIAQENTDVSLEGFQQMSIAAEDTAHVRASLENADTVQVMQSDLGRISLEGVAETLTAEMEDSTRLFANDLHTAHATITVIDHAYATIRVTQTLTANAQDWARLTFYGNPATSTIQELDLSNVRGAFEHETER